jgi:MFS transporter, MHS family, proline/betaine transporter
MTAQSDRITAAGWKIVLLASLGGTLEFYDFVIFGVFARDIGAAVFAPSYDPIVQLVMSFATFTIGYLARPIGGVVLAHYGDRYGRRAVFLWSVFIMSAATLGMGLVPPYAQIGVAASLLMVTLRLIQGFCLGGELPGALTYVVETAPRIAPFVCGVVFACVTMGVAVATGVSLSVRTYMDPALVPTYGWRIAFILGGLGGVLSFMLRRSLEESPEFVRMKSLAVRQPFKEVLRTNLAHVAVGTALLGGIGCFNGLFFSHLSAYLSTVLKYDPRQAVLAQTVGVMLMAMGTLLTGWLGDRVQPRYLLRAGAVLLLVASYPFYTALESRSAGLTMLCAMAGLVGALSAGSFAVLLTDLFPTRIRFTGVALVFNVAFTLFSGTAPLVATSLIEKTNSATAPASMMIACALIALTGSFFSGKFGGNVLARHGAE